MKRVIVNVAVGPGHERGSRRLTETVKQFSPDVHVMSWQGKYPPGSPPHAEMPYAFKIHALEAAAAKGHRRLLWLDASMYAIKPIDYMFDCADKDGAAVWQSGWMVGQWTTDAALVRLGLSRDEAMGTLLCSGGVVSINLDTEVGSTLLRRWGEYARDGISFQGKWNNKGHTCSQDPRCLGHRHDMPSLSLISRDLGLKPRLFGDGWDYFTPTPSSTTYILAQGMS